MYARSRGYKFSAVQSSGPVGVQREARWWRGTRSKPACPREATGQWDGQDAQGLSSTMVQIGARAPVVGREQVELGGEELPGGWVISGVLSGGGGT